MLPTVSVIVPVYNGERTIAECLRSLLAQKYPAERCEIMVIDNGSTDRTREIVSRFPVKLLECARRGPAAARNYGVARSEAQIIAFTDSDCVADPDWLQELVKPFADESVCAVAGLILGRDGAAATFVERFASEMPPLVNYLSGADEFLPHVYTANAAYRRSALVQMDGFNEGLFTGEDVDLAWRVQLQMGCRVAPAPDAVIHHHHRTTTAGLFRQYRQYGFGEIMLDTMYGNHPGYPRSRAFQRRRLARQIMALGRYSLSLVVRALRLLRGRATRYDAVKPALLLLQESGNILGKLDALIATRMMTDHRKVFAKKIDNYIERYY